MIYEILVRLFGTDILWAIGFLSCTIGYENQSFTVSAVIKQPITQKIQKIVKNGLKFRIEQNLNVIINDQNSYHRAMEKKLVWENGWFVNGKPIDDKDLQIEMGTASFQFSHFSFSENDAVLIFVKATILPDEEFSASTGLKTQVLWNYYAPSIKSEFIFKNGIFETQ